MTDVGNTWTPFLRFESRGAADAVASVLETEDVPTAIVACRLVRGIESDFELSVPDELLHRARWVLANSEFSDSELTYLATGQLGNKDQ